jgi:hypothetical protein
METCGRTVSAGSETRAERATSDKDFNDPNGGWEAVMDDLISHGVNIYVFDDGTEANDAAGYSAPTGNGYGVFEYDDKVIKHYSESPTWKVLQGTNNSPGIKTQIYSWLATPE